MRRTVAIVIASLFAVPSLAQIQATPRAVQKVTDPTMVIDDRGSALEVFPLQRAVPSLTTSHREVVHQIVHTDAAAPMDVGQLGVVFNHALQVQGYITGEIAFKMKGTLQATNGFEPNLYPGLARLTAPNVYVVRARTPTEFVAVTKRLQARGDLEWVEPIVTYGRLQQSTSTR